MFATGRFSPASRKNVDRETDPYIPRKAVSSVGICPKCHAIYRDKRWHLDEKEYRTLARRGDGTAVRRCPACRKISDGFPSGVVNLKGDYLRVHRDDILKIVRNEEKRARGFNPLQRIMYVNEGDAWMEVGTTDEKLAQRIGRELRKACRGTVAYKWSEDSKLLRVDWAREG